MAFVSTRGQTPPHGFLDAVAQGLAPDGGLFLPDHFPDIRARLPAWERLSYPELTAEFLHLFAPEIPREEWSALAQRAYAGFSDPAVAPLRRLDDQVRVLELFHGPTLAFKDFALQLLGLLYKRLADQGRRFTILGATSGDTGSAAIHGCLGRDGIRIIILYPDGRVSPLQERQMACTGADNVFAVPIVGTFDDAQRLVKDTFADQDFSRRHHLAAVNSINISRVLAQCVYYVWAWLRLPPEDRELVEFVVPTGNFGNILAGWLAQKMGLPAAGFRVATNQNDILYRFFEGGRYEPGEVRPSYAPSMDIQAASNFERFLYFAVDGDPARVRAAMAGLREGRPWELGRGHPAAALFSASRLGDERIPAVIRSVWDKYGYMIDPHTACGFADLNPDRVSVVLATASPAKFPEVVERATGVHPTHPTLEALKQLPMRRHPLDPTLGALRRYIEQVA